MSSSFKLAQVVAAIEKLDLAVETVFNSYAINIMVSGVKALIQLINDDPVLKFIDEIIQRNITCDIEDWLKSEKSFIESDRFILNTNRSERYCILKKLLEHCVKDSTTLESFIFTDARSWYFNGNLSEKASMFFRDFLGALYRDLRNALVDLRVEAELSKEEQVSYQSVINIVLSGNIQNIQASDMSRSNITQSRK